MSGVADAATGGLYGKAKAGIQQGLQNAGPRAGKAIGGWIEDKMTSDEAMDPNTFTGGIMQGVRGGATHQGQAAAKDYFLKGDGRKWLMGAGGVGLAGLALPLLFGGRGGGGGNAQQMQMLQQQNAMLMQMMQQGRGGNWQNQMPVANRGWRQ